MNFRVMVVVAASLVTSCSKPCEGQWPNPATAWADHAEFVPPGATVCNAKAESATMDLETASNAFVQVVTSAEAGGWQRTTQDISKADSQSVTLSKGGRTVTLAFFKQNGTYTRVLASETK